MKFVALFALCCLAGGALALEGVSHEEALEAGRRNPMNLEIIEDHKPVVRTRAPFEDLDLGATGKPVTHEVTDKPVNSHHGIGSGHNEESEVSSSTAGFPVVTEEVTSAATSEPTEATSVPVTGADRTDAPATAEPAKATSTDASRVSTSTEEENTDATNTDAPNTDASATSESSNTDASATSESSNTDSTASESSNTDSNNTDKPTEATDSSNTAPTTDSSGEGNGEQGEQKPKGLSTASISAIVIGGVLALAVIVAVAMAIVRRRRMAPERRGILDA